MTRRLWEQVVPGKEPGGLVPFSPVQATLITSSHPFDLRGLNSFMSLKIPLFYSFPQTQEIKLFYKFLELCAQRKILIVGNSSLILCFDAFGSAKTG